MTWASTISSGWRVLGLGASGKRSDVPVLGGVKAERGSVGSCLGPLRRAPTLMPGDLGVGGNAAVLIASVVVVDVVVREEESTGDGGGGEGRKAGMEYIFRCAIHHDHLISPFARSSSSELARRSSSSRPCFMLTTRVLVRARLSAGSASQNVR